MKFTLEALAAQFGDSLLLHYAADTGSPSKLIVVDGGPNGVYDDSLRPRLDEIKAQQSPDEALPIKLVMVSHIDADHIRGILDWMQDLVQLNDNGIPLTENIETLWHNSFDDVLGNSTDKLFSSLSAAVQAVSTDAPIPAELPLSHHSALVVASVPQGRTLRDQASKLGLNVNRPFAPLVMAPAAGVRPVDMDEGLTLTVLGPSEQRLRDLQTEWDKVLRRMEEKKRQGGAGADAAANAEAAAFLDKSVFNLSSIIVLAQMGSKRMLLTGDARGDDILAGLQAANLLDGQGNIEIDLLKLPHHGSDRNVSTDFFKKVRAKHFVISADGEYDNPDLPTLKMISEARPDDDFTLYITYSQPKLVQYFQEEKNRGRKYKVVFRKDEELSLFVDLA